jgi:hypothetical protein
VVEPDWTRTADRRMSARTTIRAAESHPIERRRESAAFGG